MIICMLTMSFNRKIVRMNFICVKTMLVAAAAMVSLSSFSQDLIARQAPIDRKLKSVDSLALQKQIRAEQAAYPAYSLYPSWNNEYVHAYIRSTIVEKYGKEVADNTSILYGGSCKASNAKELFANPDVDGGLIGGASLKADDFKGIIDAFNA